MTRPEYERRHRYLLWAVIAAYMLTIIGNGAGWTLYAHLQGQRAHEAYLACLDLRNRSQTSALALSAIEKAARSDGDAHMAAIWHQYTVLLKKQPLPTCKR